MALRLNLYHEELAKVRQRESDPLNVGAKLMLLVGIVAFGYYAYEASRTKIVVQKAQALEAELAKVNRDADREKTEKDRLIQIEQTADALRQARDGRFFWAPVLAGLIDVTPQNTQIASFEGQCAPFGNSGRVMLAGVAAGQDPRAVAEQLRNNLQNTLGVSYSAETRFQRLEDAGEYYQI